MNKVLFWHRIAHTLYQKQWLWLAQLFQYGIRLTFGCQIPCAVQVGPHSELAYGGLGIVIHPRVTLGSHCHISQNVTLGGTSKKYGVPQLGNHVYIGAGAVVLGPITIGDHAVIGANAVVIQSVPAHTLVAGVPAKVIKTNISASQYH